MPTCGASLKPSSSGAGARSTSGAISARTCGGSWRRSGAGECLIRPYPRGLTAGGGEEAETEPVAKPAHVGTVAVQLQLLVGRGPIDRLVSEPDTDQRTQVRVHV